MTHYYNEIDPFAAQWLRNLMAVGVIPEGDVDERSIEDVRPGDLRGYVQCHFFAGIGGWVHALDLAGWPRDRPVWTGSCPCQPFSAAGKRDGFDDQRHLWPAWFHLIRECRPPVVFGEQVASALDWLDLVQADLEGAGYAVGASDLCAAGVGAPHIRQRLYFVADTDSERRHRIDPLLRAEAGGRDSSNLLEVARGGEAGSLGHAHHARPQGHGRPVGQHDAAGREAAERHGATAGFWSDAEWLQCSDGKARPVEPGTFPLADGVSGRVGRLRAYGNAIVPQVAAAFVSAYLDAGLALEAAA